MVPKKVDLHFMLSYLGKPSLKLRTRLRQTIEQNLPYCELEVVFRFKSRLHTLFLFKDQLQKKSTLNNLSLYV